MLVASKKKWFDKQRNMFLLLFLLAVVCLIVLLMFYAPFRYRYGWVASGIVVLLLAVFLGLGFRKALKQKSIFGQMVSLTILCTFTAEILLYIPANLGIWLIAPIALPFLSYGATALFINMALAGVLLSVFRTGEVYRDTAPHPIFSDSKFIQWADGKLTISFK